MLRKTIISTLISVMFILSVHAKVIKVVYYPNGSVKMEMIKLKKGIVEINQYYPSGALFEKGYSKNGMLQGQWTRFDKDGNIIATDFYQNNAKIGSWNHYNRWSRSTSQVRYQNGKAVSYRKFDYSGRLIALETKKW